MRLIDADKLLKKAITVEDVNWTGRTKIMVDKNDIDASRTIDVKPVVHAHWTRMGVTPYSNKIVWNCSNCGCNYRLNIEDKPKKYCGDCGAKMDEEVDND